MKVNLIEGDKGGFNYPLFAPLKVGKRGLLPPPEPNLLKLFIMNPKGGELLLIIVKSEETQMEANMHSDAQIDAMN